jgi:hypothetical protein
MDSGLTFSLSLGGRGQVEDSPWRGEGGAYNRHVAMKHRGTKIVLFLFLVSGGAIINIALAWTTEILDQPTWTQSAAILKVLTTRVVVGSPPEATYPDAAYERITLPMWHIHGWPFDSPTRCGMLFPVDRTRTSTQRLWIEGWSLPDSAAKALHRDKVVLSVRPASAGFVINTFFYAAILWLPFAALGTFRRRRRIKRGLCPGCGYDLRGRGGHQNLCPECGAAVAMPDSRNPTAESPQ